MRLGAKKHIYVRSSHIPSGKAKAVLFLLFVCLCALVSLLYFAKIMHPQMIVLAKNKASVLAENAMQKALGNVFVGEEFSDLVVLQHVEDGSVSNLFSDTSKVNALKSKVSLAINKEIESLDTTKLHIPLGNLTGISVFAGIGPKIPIEVMPYGRTIVDFSSDFSQSGINQTRLSINLSAKTTVGILMPGAQTSQEISTTVPIVQTIIVGEVPDNYVHIDRYGEEYEGDVLDLIG